MNTEQTELAIGRDDKIKLLTDWIAMLESDIDEMSKHRNAQFAHYSKLKTTTDSWLAGRMKKLNKIDKRITGKKNTIKEIIKEIAEIEVRPLPGNASILPEISRVPKKIKIEEVKSEDIANFEFTDEERAIMNAEAGRG